ncbi:hypothetical protein V6N12_040087 [Hibiscus sabdariffa]|uniref:non-specific serine/threonine protein kinase n=1 Tax=Hibiscus sabdariffa TaxID=183260 RepID=A0ABR2E2P4_9ROSI
MINLSLKRKTSSSLLGLTKRSYSSSVFGNRLSGSIPTYLGNITSLRYLDLEANQFSGQVPPEIGKLVNLRTLRLSSNRLTGNLPVQLAELENLTNFRINDNNFNGSIPAFIQNWKKLTRLEMQASGLAGSIPSSISALENLITLIISDINGTTQHFPDLWNMTSIHRIILKKCNIVGQIPQQIWQMSQLRILDLSFNMLSGEVVRAFLPNGLRFLYLTGNNLSGNIPDSILQTGVSVDLSYNNFTWPSPNQPACLRKLDNVNLFRSSSTEYLIFSASFVQAKIAVLSLADWHSMYINCGGNSDVKVNGTMYVGDAKSGLGGAATLYENGDNWGFSSTGDFRDDNDELNAASRYVKHTVDMSNQLYATARLSPLSITYYRYCLENGSYSVRLHFAEIEITNSTKYGTLGRRIFNIYIQDQLVEEDFNIEAEAGGILTPLSKHYNADVTNGELEIHFYWAGKGTQAIPVRGVHGPLISAISVDPNFKPKHEEKKTKTLPIVIGVVGSFLVSLASGILFWRCYFKAKSQREQDLKGLDLQTVSFTLKQIKAATNNFDSGNKIGEGGFGPVYKGQLGDGTIIAVKQLSSKSSQGNPKLNDEDKTHISTRIAGTIGYIAPEYALWGYLTHKADVYSFGIVALELVSGKHNMNYGPVGEHTCLLDWACHLQQSGKLLELVDDKLGSDYNKSEAERMIKVALLCTNATPSLRPTMSDVVGMLEGTITIPDIVPDASSYNEDLRFKAIRDHRSSTHTHSQVHTSTSTGSQLESPSASAHGIHETNE